MTTRLIGGILLIVGTAIGGGMLALPLVTAKLGFIGSIFMLTLCWAIMFYSALLLLEANLWLDDNSNLISMTKATLGIVWQVIAWLSYLFLMYAVLAAFMAAGGDYLNAFGSTVNVNIPQWLGSVIFSFIFGVVVYFGIRAVDLCNRGLMCLKLGSYILLVILAAPYVKAVNLLHYTEPKVYIITGLSIIITAFTFANLVPTLRVYFNNNIKQLKIAIFIGSLIPLICYILWDMVIMGIIPIAGANGLVAISSSDHAASGFVVELGKIVNRHSIEVVASIFTTVCITTTFLALALGLSDFLVDGLKIKKVGFSGNCRIYLATFIPPLLITIFFPGIFLKALVYAGIFCIILFALLPSLIVWAGRYKKNFVGEYKVKGGKLPIVFIIIFSVFVILQAVYLICF